MTDPDHIHPVRVVAQRTGLSPDVLRAWERRYHAVRPVRTAGGQRLYTSADIERLALLHQATRTGRQIHQLTPLDNAALRQLIASDLRDAPEDSPPRAAELHLDRAFEAVKSLEPRALERELRRAVLALGGLPMLGDVLAPLLQRIGAAWHAGSLSVAHEHAASAVVRRTLDWIAAAHSPGPGAPVVGLATLPGERHEFGAMVAMAAALSNGWNTIYFGPDMPAEDLVAAAVGLGVRAVGVSIVYVDEAERVAGALRQVREALPPGIALIVGGSGLARIRGQLAGLDLQLVEDVAGFADALAPLVDR